MRLYLYRDGRAHATARATSLGISTCTQVETGYLLGVDGDAAVCIGKYEKSTDHARAHVDGARGHLGTPTEVAKMVKVWVAGK